MAEGAAAENQAVALPVAALRVEPRNRAAHQGAAYNQAVAGNRVCSGGPKDRDGSQADKDTGLRNLPV
jgi:hypothetical protein